MSKKDLIVNETMTLKEITDLLSVRHDKAMKIVEKMAEDQSFGSVSKMDSQYVSGKGRTETIKTYALNKRQSIAVASRLNTALLMRVIDRWQELEQKEIYSFSPEQDRKYIDSRNNFTLNMYNSLGSDVKIVTAISNIINLNVLGMNTESFRTFAGIIDLNNNALRTRAWIAQKHRNVIELIENQLLSSLFNSKIDKNSDNYFDFVDDICKRVQAMNDYDGLVTIINYEEMAMVYKLNTLEIVEIRKPRKSDYFLDRIERHKKGCISLPDLNNLRLQ